MGRRRIIGLGTLRLTRAPNENPKRLRAAAAPLPKAAANIAKFPEGPQFPPVHLHRRIQVAQQHGDTPHWFALLGVANVSFGSLAAAARSQWDVRFAPRKLPRLSAADVSAKGQQRTTALQQKQRGFLCRQITTVLSMLRFG
jgi:hypothetical protein